MFNKTEIEDFYKNFTLDNIAMEYVEHEYGRNYVVFFTLAELKCLDIWT